MKTVILAGGRGTRLKPYTIVFPKPLMPIGDRPILEIIVRQLKVQNLKDIVIATGHLSELIETFFGDGSKLGVNIEYSREDKALGTVGALGLIKEKLTDTFLMLNGDTLTTIDFVELIEYHKRNGATVTIALKKREVYIDFGIVELDDVNTIKGYTEKPTIEHLVSMGAYVFEPEALEYVEVGQRLDFPELVNTLISNGETVKGFVFDGYWLDIGRPEDYQKANEELGDVFGELSPEDL